MAVFWNSQMLTVDQCFTITAVVWYGAVIKKEKVWQRERKINTHCVITVCSVVLMIPSV